MLTQQQQNSDYQPIAYGSWALTPTESHYSQTERELLAVVVWSCQYFHYYVYYNKTTIITDHKPLQKLLSSTSNSTPPIQRWVLWLQAFDTIIQYRPRSTNPADFLSWHPPLPSHQVNDQSAEHYIMLSQNPSQLTKLKMKHLRILLLLQDWKKLTFTNWNVLLNNNKSL